MNKGICPLHFITLEQEDCCLTKGWRYALFQKDAILKMWAFHCVGVCRGKNDYWCVS